MDPDKDNANPTILNASDLPSRRETDATQPRADGGTGLFDGLVPLRSYVEDPFESYISSSEDDMAEDDVEEIDAQEIYGTRIPVLRLPGEVAPPYLNSNHGISLR